jgi:ATP-dependent Lon protease
MKKGLDIVPVWRMDDVLPCALVRKPEAIDWDETMTTAATVPQEASVEEEAATVN